MPYLTSVGRWRRLATLLPLLGVLSAATRAAQPLREVVQQALDQTIRSRIELPEKPIREALDDLEARTGLRFVLDATAADWMPYGEQTRIAIVMENVSVREGLGRIFAGLGLAMRVADDRIMVEPAPVLERLSRRLTLDEVATLQLLAERSWSSAGKGLAIDLRLPPDQANAERRLDDAVARAPGASAIEQLESATAALGWTWTPLGKGIVVYGRAEDVSQRLDRAIDVNYRRVPLDEMLVDLGRRIGVTVYFEPGVLQRVSARQRNVDLIQRHTTVRQVLELIVGNTGLAYEVGATGILITSPRGTAEPPPDGTPRDPGPVAPGSIDRDASRVVAILRIPVGTDGTTIDFLIRADELPEEFRQLRARKMPEVIEILRQRLRE